MDFLGKVEDNSVHLAVVDPPYNMKKAEWDSFAGSGTTAIVAKQLKRNFIVCENNREYYELSLRNLGKIA